MSTYIGKRKRNGKPKPTSLDQGVEIIFSEPLLETPSGISPGGAVFLHQFVKRYDLEKGTLVLRDDYDVFQNLTDKNRLLFRGAAPDAVEFHVAGNIVRSIRDMASNRVVFQR